MRYERPRLLDGYDKLDGILAHKSVAILGAGSGGFAPTCVQVRG